MKIKFFTLVIIGAEDDMILLHSKTLIGLFLSLSNHPIYEQINEDIYGNIESTTELEEFIELYNNLEDAQFELKLYSNQTISF